MDIVELLQREIQEHKMAWSKLKEENVVLRGFKAIVMKDPKKYAHNNPPETLFDEERRKFKEEHKLRQEAEGELTILKGIETNRVKEAQVRSDQLQNELDRVKLDNNNLYTRVADALEVNEHHQKLNGKLQERVTELEQDNLELHADNKKLAKQIEDKIDSLRRAGF